MLFLGVSESANGCLSLWAFLHCKALAGFKPEFLKAPYVSLPFLVVLPSHLRVTLLDGPVQYLVALCSMQTQPGLVRPG